MIELNSLSNIKKIIKNWEADCDIEGLDDDVRTDLAKRIARNMVVR